MTSLHLIVHDYDPTALVDRMADLSEAFPRARLEPFAVRNEFLTRIAKLPQHATHRPIALIDLQGDQDRRARGVHLIATISRHSGLSDRVVAVAFTLYGHPSRYPLLEMNGARGVLNPAALPAGRHESIEADLKRLAGGDQHFVRIGEPVATAEDRTVIERLRSLFPEEFPQSRDEGEEWACAKEILCICRMALDRYSDRDISARLGLSDKRLKKLRAQLVINPEALRIEAVSAGRTADLGAVARSIYQSTKEPEVRWTLTAELDDLFQLARLQLAHDRFSDRYGSAADHATDFANGPVWMSPRQVQLMRIFLTAHERARKAAPKPNPDIATIDSWRDAALREAARVANLELRIVRDEIEHAILCIEETDLDGGTA